MFPVFILYFLFTVSFEHFFGLRAVFYIYCVFVFVTLSLPPLSNFSCIYLNILNLTPTFSVVNHRENEYWPKIRRRYRCHDGGGDDTVARRRWLRRRHAVRGRRSVRGRLLLFGRGGGGYSDGGGVVRHHNNNNNNNIRGNSR